MPAVGFEPTISTGERPHTYALDRVATGTSLVIYHEQKYCMSYKRRTRYEHDKPSSHYLSQTLCEIFKTKRCAKEVSMRLNQVLVFPQLEIIVLNLQQYPYEGRSVELSWNGGTMGQNCAGYVIEPKSRGRR